MDERFLRYIITTKIIIDQDHWSPINNVLLHMDEIVQEVGTINSK
jgi:hypothetical protein